jgi:hypothetical protein
MAMFLIAGSFRITGAQPDGDSIRFTPSDPAKWDLITRPNRVKRNASGAAQLRLDAIDALETHYGSPRTHQPLGLAHAAADELLDWLGFSNVVRAQDETVTSSSPDTVAGYILTRSADLYGRCIAFVLWSSWLRTSPYDPVSYSINHRFVCPSLYRLLVTISTRTGHSPAAVSAWTTLSRMMRPISTSPVSTGRTSDM